MLTFVALAVTFIIGGFTFLPLVLATFLGFIFYTSPVVHLPLKTGIPKHEPPPEEEAEIVTLFRAGWLTVRRTYEPLVGAGEGTYVGMMVSGYRSFMDNRSRDPRRSKPKDKFFAVLKQNVLFLYENEEQVDCWAAVEVTAHDVMLYPEDGPDGELFVKRNAMCLRPRGLSMDALAEFSAASEQTTHDLEPGKPLPWFLFAKVNSDKEDWYHSLIQASKLGGPTATATIAKDRSLFDPDDMARLVEGIDQQPDSIPMRWMNAMLGRVLLSVYRTESLEAYIISRIVRKLKRVKTPSMLSEVQVREVNVGSSAPFFSKPMLKELTPDGDASMEVHVSYVGEMRITIETVATINLGSRFKPYSVRLVLAVVLKEIEGTLLLKIKKPPSNRVWFGFSSMPRMVLSVEPVVSTRQIKWSMITSPIESRIREIILESIVVPHMDDFPFFNSKPYSHRGGIWGDALRKERDVNTPEGGPGDEAHTIGQDDPLEDEPVGEPILSTAREDSPESMARQRLSRRRRSSDGDNHLMDPPSEASGVETSSRKTGLGSSTSSLSSSFSLASWRDGKKDYSTGPNGEKKRSWFNTTNLKNNSSSASVGSTTPPTSSVPTLSRTSTSTNESLSTTPSESTGPDLSAARLREMLTKRAHDREKEKENAKPSSSDNLDEIFSTPSLSGLSLTAPSSTSASSSSTPLPLTESPSLNEDVPQFPAGSKAPLSISPSSVSSVPELLVEAPSPVVSPPLSKSVSATGISSELESTSAPSTPSRKSSLSKVVPVTPPTLPPRRPSHQATQSADASGPSSMTFASAATTASILASWRTKAADKQALAAGVAQAKDTMKRWGATWNARKSGGAGADNGESGNESDSHHSGGDASSPPQDMGRSLPLGSSRSQSSSHSPSREPTYRDYRANKTKNDYYGGMDDSHPSASTSSAPIPIAPETPRKRRESGTNAPSALLNPASPQPTLWANTVPTFASASPPSGGTRPPPQPLPSTTPPIAIAPRAYKPQAAMAIPGIRDSSHRKAVASDHVSAEEVSRAGSSSGSTTTLSTLPEPTNAPVETPSPLTEPLISTRTPSPKLLPPPAADRPVPPPPPPRPPPPPSTDTLKTVAPIVVDTAPASIEEKVAAVAGSEGEGPDEDTWGIKEDNSL